MKKYRKPILDIVEFDNLDVVIMSGDKNSDPDSEIQSYNELSLNQVEISPIPVGVTETPAPADPLEPAPADPLELTPADDENPAEDQTDDSAENPADDDELAAQTVPEDEVE